MSSQLSPSLTFSNPYLCRIWSLAEELERDSQPRLAALHLTSVLLHPEDCGWEGEKQTPQLSSSTCCLPTPHSRKRPAQDLSRCTFPPYCRQEELRTRLKAAGLLLEEVEKLSGGVDANTPSEVVNSLTEECLSLARVLLSPLFLHSSTRPTRKDVDEMIMATPSVREEDGEEEEDLSTGKTKKMEGESEGLERNGHSPRPFRSRSSSVLFSPHRCGRSTSGEEQLEEEEAEGSRRKRNSHCSHPYSLKVEKSGDGSEEGDEEEEEKGYRQVSFPPLSSRFLERSDATMRLFSLLEEEDEDDEEEEGEGEDTHNGKTKGKGEQKMNKRRSNHNTNDDTIEVDEIIKVLDMEGKSRCKMKNHPMSTAINCRPSRSMFFSTMIDTSTAVSHKMNGRQHGHIPHYAFLDGALDPWGNQTENNYFFHPLHVSTLTWRESNFSVHMPEELMTTEGRQAYSRGLEPRVTEGDGEEEAGKHRTASPLNPRRALCPPLFCWFHRSDCHPGKTPEVEKHTEECGKQTHPVPPLSFRSTPRVCTSTPFALLLRAYLLLSRWYRLCGNLSAALDVLQCGKKRLDAYFASPRGLTTSVSCAKWPTRGMSSRSEEKKRLLQELENRFGGFGTSSSDDDDTLMEKYFPLGVFEQYGDRNKEKVEDTYSCLHQENGRSSLSYSGFPSCLRSILAMVLDVLFSQEECYAHLLWEAEYCSVLHAMLQWLSSTRATIPTTVSTSASSSSRSRSKDHWTRSAGEEYKRAHDSDVCLSELIAHSSTCFFFDYRFRRLRRVWSFGGALETESDDNENSVDEREEQDEDYHDDHKKTNGEEMNMTRREETDRREGRRTLWRLMMVSRRRDTRTWMSKPGVSSRSPRIKNEGHTLIDPHPHHHHPLGRTRGLSPPPDKSPSSLAFPPSQGKEGVKETWNPPFSPPHGSPPWSHCNCSIPYRSPMALFPAVMVDEGLPCHLNSVEEVLARDGKVESGASERGRAAEESALPPLTGEGGDVGGNRTTSMTRKTSRDACASHFPSVALKVEGKAKALRVNSVLASLLLPLRGQLDPACFISWSHRYREPRSTTTTAPSSSSSPVLSHVVGEENADVLPSLHLLAFFHAHTVVLSWGTSHHETPYTTLGTKGRWGSEKEGDTRKCFVHSSSRVVERVVRRCAEIGRRAGTAYPHRTSVFPSPSPCSLFAAAFPSEKEVREKGEGMFSRPSDKEETEGNAKQEKGKKSRGGIGNSCMADGEGEKEEEEEKNNEMEWDDEFTMLQSLFSFSFLGREHRGTSRIPAASTITTGSETKKTGRIEILRTPPPSTLMHWTTASWRCVVQRYYQFCCMAAAIPTPPLSLRVSPGNITTSNTTASSSSTTSSASSSASFLVESTQPREKNRRITFPLLTQFYSSLLKEIDAEMFRLSNGDGNRTDMSDDVTPISTSRSSPCAVQSTSMDKGIIDEEAKEREGKGDRKRRRNSASLLEKAQGGGEAEALSPLISDLSRLPSSSFSGSPRSGRKGGNSFTCCWRSWRLVSRSSCSSLSHGRSVKGRNEEWIRKGKRKKHTPESNLSLSFSPINTSLSLSFLLLLKSSTYLIMASTALRQRYPLECVHCLAEWRQYQNTQASPTLLAPMRVWGHLLAALLALQLGVTDLPTHRVALSLSSSSRLSSLASPGREQGMVVEGLRTIQWGGRRLRQRGDAPTCFLSAHSAVASSIDDGGEVRMAPCSRDEWRQHQQQQYAVEEQATMPSSAYMEVDQKNFCEKQVSLLVTEQAAHANDEEEEEEDELAALVGLPYYHLLMAEVLATGNGSGLRGMMPPSRVEGGGGNSLRHSNTLPNSRTHSPHEGDGLIFSHSLFTSSPSFLLQLQLLKLFAIYYTACPSRPRVAILPPLSASSSISTSRIAAATTTTTSGPAPGAYASLSSSDGSEKTMMKNREEGFVLDGEKEEGNGVKTEGDSTHDHYCKHEKNVSGLLYHETEDDEMMSRKKRRMGWCSSTSGSGSSRDEGGGCGDEIGRATAKNCWTVSTSGAVERAAERDGRASGPSSEICNGGGSRVSKEEEQGVECMEKNYIHYKVEKQLDKQRRGSSFFHSDFSPSSSSSFISSPAFLLRSGALEVTVHAPLEAQQRCQHICRIKLENLLQEFNQILAEEEKENEKHEKEYDSGGAGEAGVMGMLFLHGTPVTSTSSGGTSHKGRIPAEAWTASNRSLLLLIHGLFAATEDHDPFLARKQWKRALEILKQGSDKSEQRGCCAYKGHDWRAENLRSRACKPSVSPLKTVKSEEEYLYRTPWEQEIIILLSQVMEPENMEEEEAKEAERRGEEYIPIRSEDPDNVVHVCARNNNIHEDEKAEEDGNLNTEHGQCEAERREGNFPPALLPARGHIDYGTMRSPSRAISSTEVTRMSHKENAEKKKFNDSHDAGIIAEECQTPEVEAAAAEASEGYFHPKIFNHGIPLQGSCMDEGIDYEDNSSTRITSTVNAAYIAHHSLSNGSEGAANMEYDPTTSSTYPQYLLKWKTNSLNKGEEEPPPSPALLRWRHAIYDLCGGGLALPSSPPINAPSTVDNVFNSVPKTTTTTNPHNVLRAYPHFQTDSYLATPSSRSSSYNLRAITLDLLQQVLGSIPF